MMMLGIEIDTATGKCYHVARRRILYIYTPPNPPLPPVIMHLGTHPLTAPGRDGGNQKLKRYLLLGTRHVGLRPERAYQQEYAPE